MAEKHETMNKMFQKILEVSRRCAQYWLTSYFGLITCLVLREINLNYKGLLKQFFCNETLFLKNISNINKYVDELKNSTIFILDNPQIIYEGSLD